MLYILIILAATQIILCILLYRSMRKQQKTTLIIREYQAYISKHLNFNSDANEMILWKIRYDILVWVNQFIKTENYEMAQQATLASNIIEGMINSYRNHLKHNPK